MTKDNADASINGYILMAQVNKNCKIKCINFCNSL